VWVGNPAAGSTVSTDDPFPAPARTSGTWQTIRSGHVLVFLADTPGNWFAGNVLDWVPHKLGMAGSVRIWRLDRTITSGDAMPNKLDDASFSTIGVGHTLIYLDGDRVLDWEPASGRARVWQYDRSRTNRDPLPTKVTENTWATIRTGHQLVYLGGDLVLDWEGASGDVRVWRYDRSLSGNVDPLPTQETGDNWAAKIPSGRLLHYLAGDRALEWDPGSGQERIWDFDRPLMPNAQFQAMLNGDIATAVGWVAAAQTALAAYQGAVIGGGAVDPANVDSAEEWQPAYATLTSQQAITNPSSYAAFAHNIATGIDLRFGNEPWQ